MNVKGGFLCMVTWALCTCGSAFAANSGFDRLVKEFSTHYHVQPKVIPPADLDESVVQMTQSFGMTTRDCAVFQKPDFSEEGVNEDFLSKAGDALGPTWRSAVRVHSRRGHEMTLIYFDESQVPMQVMMVSIEQGEARILRLEAAAKQPSPVNGSTTKSSQLREDGRAAKSKP